MTIEYFTTTIDSLQELKNQYKSLAKKYHPDLGGNNEAMKAVNLEYEYLFNLISTGSGYSPAPEFELEKEFMDIIQQISNLDGIVIELVGKWVWVSGNTINHKEVLKANGFRFAKIKKMWYWHNGTGFRSSKTYDMDSIREKYGTKVMNKEFKSCLA